MTYVSIFSYENIEYSVENEHNFTNIQGLPFKTNEKVINSRKAKKLLKSKLTNCDFVFNEVVTNIEEDEEFIAVNDKYKCKFLFDCTYNQMGIDKSEYSYELTLSLLYKKIGFFGGLTVVDGDFCSLYPRENDIYTLTDVEHTPLYKSSKFSEVESFQPTEETILNTKSKMEEKITSYYPDFHNNFIYEGYFLSHKTKI